MVGPRQWLATHARHVPSQMRGSAACMLLSCQPQRNSRTNSDRRLAHQHSPCTEVLRIHLHSIAHHSTRSAGFHLSFLGCSVATVQIHDLRRGISITITATALHGKQPLARAVRRMPGTISDGPSVSLSCMELHFGNKCAKANRYQSPTTSGAKTMPELILSSSA